MKKELMQLLPHEAPKVQSHKVRPAFSLAQDRLKHSVDYATPARTVSGRLTKLAVLEKSSILAPSLGHNVSRRQDMASVLVYSVRMTEMTIFDSVGRSANMMDR